MEAHTTNTDTQIINYHLTKHNIDIAVAAPQLDEKKKNYKKVLYFKDKPKYDGSAVNDELQYIIRNTNEYQEADYDFNKRMKPEEASIIKSIMPETFSFGRDGIGHDLFKVIDLPENPRGTTQVEFDGAMLNELRADGCYSIFYGKLDETARATLGHNEIAEITYKDLHDRFNYQNVLAALTIIGGKDGGMNKFIQAIAGEFFTQEIPENITLKVFKKFLGIIKRKDRETETEKSIKSIYRSGKASNLFTKKYDNINLSHDAKLEFRKIVRSLIDDQPVNPAVSNSKPKSDPTAWRLGTSAADLEAMELKPIEWVVEGLIAPGLNIIAGKSKIGKSWAVLDLGYQVEIGGTWLSRKCIQGSVLFYSLEDYKQRMKNRWKTMGVQPKETWYQFRDRRPKIPLLTMGLEEEIEDWIKNTPDAKLVIIDVYQKVKKSIGGKLNAYENDNFNLQDLQTLAAKYNMAIVLVHHTKKGSEADVFDEINGSAGIQSNMDSMIVLASKRKVGSNIVLHCIPKDGEPQEFEIAMNSNCIWEYLGAVGTTKLSALNQAIVKLFESTDRKMAVKEVQDFIQNDGELNMDREKPYTKADINKALERLSEKSEIMKVSRGMYNKAPF